MCGIKSSITSYHDFLITKCYHLNGNTIAYFSDNLKCSPWWICHLGDYSLPMGHSWNAPQSDIEYGLRFMYRVNACYVVLVKWWHLTVPISLNVPSMTLERFYNYLSVRKANLKKMSSKIKSVHCKPMTERHPCQYFVEYSLHSCRKVHEFHTWWKGGEYFMK